MKLRCFSCTRCRSKQDMDNKITKYEKKVFFHIKCSYIILVPILLPYIIYVLLTQIVIGPNRLR